MPVPSDRVADRLSHDFGTSAPLMLGALERLPVPPQVDPERVHAAVLISAKGNPSLFEDALEHAHVDWRDLLDRAGLADSEWRGVIDDEFGAEPGA